MTRFVTTIFIVATSLHCVAAALEANEGELAEELVKFESCLESDYIAEWGDHWTTTERIRKIEQEIKQPESLVGVKKSVDKNIRYSRIVEELLMKMISNGEHREISNMGCSVVDLHGSISQHIRQLNNLKFCVQDQGVSCGSHLRILSANADRTKGTISKCISILDELGVD